MGAPSEPFDVVVVGAGLSALMAARRLVDAGLSVILVERESVAGGRLATWRSGLDHADIGAQFFTIRTDEFAYFVEQWLAAGWITEWARGWSDGTSLSSGHDGYPRYIAADGFAALANHLSVGLTICFDTQLGKILADGDHWLAMAVDGREFAGRSLVLTPPAPQSLALLDAGGVALPSEQRVVLDSIQYGPCLCGVFAIDGDTIIPEPGALQRPNDPISWVADNRRKGMSKGGRSVLTIQANSEASTRRWAEADEAILTWMAAELEPWLVPGARLQHLLLKRWAYAAPLNVYPERCLVVPGPTPLVLAGDAFDGPRIEGAALSGLAAAEFLNRNLGG